MRKINPSKTAYPKYIYVAFLVVYAVFTQFCDIGSAEPIFIDVTESAGVQFEHTDYPDL